MKVKPGNNGGKQEKSLEPKDRIHKGAQNVTAGHYSMKSGKVKRKYLTRVPSRTLDPEDGQLMAGTEQISGDNANATGFGRSRQGNGQY